MSKKILVPLAEGFEELEAITIIDLVRRANLEVVTASLTDNLYVNGAHNIVVKADTSFSNIIDEDFDGISLAGGMNGMNNLKNDARVISKIKDMHSKNKLVSAMCASPIVLGIAGVLEGDYTCYPSCRESVEIGNYIEEDLVVVDKNVITSKGPATAMLFALEIVKYLKGSEDKDLKNALLANLAFK